ncbi:S-layer protein, partial [Pseudomonas sp. NZIPFR-PS2]
EADIQALASSAQWLTTKVYVEGEPDKDVKANYPGVVGISMWDPLRNRYEFFYTDTGRSKHADGGGGYFMVTGDRKTHILFPDLGPNRTIVRRLEKLDNREFTYSREVPRNMIPTQPPVRIYVVHAPYKGPIKTAMSN